MKYRFLTNVKNGKLEFVERDKFIGYVKGLRDGIYELDIGNVSKDRSLPQNNYYWGVLIRMISDEIGMTPDTCHEMLKWKFLRSEYRCDDVVYEYARSTTSLDTKEFSDYCEKLQMWAASELNLNIPNPNEVI